MKNNSYGWIGKMDINTAPNRRKGTKTAGYLLYYFKKNGAVTQTEIRSKNLVWKERVPYYILSIGEGETSWAPYLFIEKFNDLREFHFVLTQDTGESKGILWDVEISEIEILSEESLRLGNRRNRITLRKQKRKQAGDYYRLSMAQVKELMGPEEKGIEFTLDNLDELTKEILQKEEDSDELLAK